MTIELEQAKAKRDELVLQISMLKIRINDLQKEIAAKRDEIRQYNIKSFEYISAFDVGFVDAQRSENRVHTNDDLIRGAMFNRAEVREAATDLFKELQAELLDLKELSETFETMVLDLNAQVEQQERVIVALGRVVEKPKGIGLERNSSSASSSPNSNSSLLGGSPVRFKYATPRDFVEGFAAPVDAGNEDNDRAIKCN